MQSWYQLWTFLWEKLEDLNLTYTVFNLTYKTQILILVTLTCLLPAPHYLKKKFFFYLKIFQRNEKCTGVLFSETTVIRIIDLKTVHYACKSASDYNASVMRIRQFPKTHSWSAPVVCPVPPRFMRNWHILKQRIC